MITEAHVTEGWLVVGHDDGWLNLVPFEAIASWSELLGISDPVEVVTAIEAVNQNGEAPVDPATKENPWTAGMTLLAHREAAREKAAQEHIINKPVDDPRSPALVGAFAAYRAVHEPIDGGECAMNKCRRASRDSHALQEPTGIRTVGSRSRAPVVGDHADDPDKQKLADVLTGHEGELLERTRRFLHDLSGREDNPLADVTPSPAESDPANPYDVMRRFGAHIPFEHE